jgi:integrase
MYLSRNRLGIYCYRRPVIAEDQAFWFGPSGKPKKEWGRSLRTTDRRTAIGLLSDAADAYEADRAEQLARAASRATPEAAAMSLREREEREAAAVVAAAKQARYNGQERQQVRTLFRRIERMTTGELPVEHQAVHDLLAEKEIDKGKLRETVALLEAKIVSLGGTVRNLPASPVVEGRTIEKLIEAYEADKLPGWSGSSKKAVTPVFRLLRDVFAGRDLVSINRGDAREVVKLLEKLPAQLGKRPQLKGLTIRQAVEKGRELALLTIAPKTINDGYLMHIAAMWNWAVKEQWLTSSPFIGLSVHDPVEDADRRDPFSADQLTTLFSNAPWSAPWIAGGAKPGAYWVPLLCMYHGLRNGEAAGLRVEDIGHDDGVPVIRIRAYDGKLLKTKEARGNLPIHPELLRTGFLDFVAERRDAGAELLFPEGACFGNSRTGISVNPGQRFS